MKTMIQPIYNEPALSELGLVVDNYDLLLTKK
jgi:hypothetical protein